MSGMQPSEVAFCVPFRCDVRHALIKENETGKGLQVEQQKDY
jgi:hypothetical protein